MARFKYSGVAATGGTGRLNSTLGGSVLLKNGVVRNYVTPTNPQTASQLAGRAAFSTISQAWSGLSNDQRTGWDVAAASGDWPIPDSFTGTPRNPTSGKELFQQLNLNLYLANGAGWALLTAVPAKEAGGNTAASTFSIGYEAGPLYTVLLAYSGALGTNEIHLVKATGYQSAGTMKLRKNQLRDIMTSSSAGSVNMEVSNQYSTLFGVPDASQEGKKVFVQLWAINTVTGQRRVAGSANGQVEAL